MVFDVTDVSHRVAYFKIYFVGTVEYTVKDGFELGINICLFVSLALIHI